MEEQTATHSGVKPHSLKVSPLNTRFYKFVESEIETGETSGGDQQLYEHNAHVYLMNVGRFIKRENEIRIQTTCPIKPILEYVQRRWGIAKLT